METIFDKNVTQLHTGDTVIYTDSEHGIENSTGYIRYNYLSSIFEVINSDEQSGNSFSNITNVLWQ